jgi:hypothetical protein
LNERVQQATNVSAFVLLDLSCWNCSAEEEHDAAVIDIVLQQPDVDTVCERSA